MSKSPATTHVGFKTIGMILGLILATIYSVIDFFVNWLSAADLKPVVFKWLFAVVVLLIVWPLIVYLAHILWRFAYGVEEKYIKVE